MTQLAEPTTMELQIVSCETCDQLFLVSPRRETCPACGGPPGLEFFSFEASRDGVRLLGGIAAAPADVTNLAQDPVDVLHTDTVDQEETPETLPFHAECPMCGADLDVSVTPDAITVAVSPLPGPEPDDVPETPTAPETAPEFG